MFKVYQMFCAICTICIILKTGKHPRRNVTFSKVAHLHYSWKYNIRSNVNSDLSIVTILFCSLIESIGVIKKI